MYAIGDTIRIAQFHRRPLVELRQQETNDKNKLDPALVRPGHMDVHVHMSYCTPCGFRLPASNYLGIKEHILFSEIEDQIEAVQVTPAEVAELMIKSDEPDVALQGLIEFFKVKKKESEEADEAKRKQELEAEEKESTVSQEAKKDINKDVDD